MSFHVTRLGAAALALSLALGAGSAFAQTAPAKPAAPAPAPAPAQPAPAAQPAPGGQPAAPPPPSKVDLVSPEPQWAKFCAKEPNTGKDACATMRDFATSADQPPMVSINVFELAGEERRKLRFLMLPIGMLLKPGFRVIIDKGDPIEGKYDMCFQNACSAEIDIGASTLASLKKGQTLSVVMRVPGNGEPSGRELTFNIPLKDFGPSFDGKPTDPKLLEQQRQQLQQQLQKRAEEQRKQLEQQQSGVAAPGAAAPAAAPAAPAAAPAPQPKQ
jgi:invasion protein IalB